jgi:hypothetical protein
MSQALSLIHTNHIRIHPLDNLDGKVCQALPGNIHMQREKKSGSITASVGWLKQPGVEIYLDPS